jgi:hypothetical protein
LPDSIVTAEPVSCFKRRLNSVHFSTFNSLQYIFSVQEACQCWLLSAKVSLFDIPLIDGLFCFNPSSNLFACGVINKYHINKKDRYFISVIHTVSRELEAIGIVWRLCDVHIQVVALAPSVLAIADAAGAFTADKIYIYDGNSDTSPLIAALSSYKEPPYRSFISSQRYVLVKFVSDGSNVYRGFNITYKTSQGNN